MNLAENTGTIPSPQIPLRSNVNDIDAATLDLLASWRRQDATDDPEKIRAAERELAEFKEAMNDTRRASGAPPVYPSADRA